MRRIVAPLVFVALVSLAAMLPTVYANPGDGVKPDIAA
jgi:hypothetical protein